MILSLQRIRECFTASSLKLKNTILRETKALVGCDAVLKN